MEFWGVEVKPGETLKVKPDLFSIIHISQAALGEVNNVKGSLTIPLRMKINGKDYLIGRLSTQDRPQMMVDLVIEKEFELSHDWKNGSVYFSGYTADNPSDDEYNDEEEFSSDEDGAQENVLSAKGNGKLKHAEDGGLSSDESGDSGMAEDSDDIMVSDSELDLSEDDEVDSSSGDDAPSKDQLTRKRPVTEPPISAKKAKLSAHGKTGGKKSQAGKAPSPKNNSKPKNAKAPQSGGKAKRGGR